MYKRITYCLQLAVYGWLILSAAGLLPSDVAGAQAGRQLTANQIDADTWPDVTLNLSLTGPDGKAIPDVSAQQIQVLEDGQPQAVQQLQFGPPTDVPLSLVLTMDISGSMNADRKLPQAKEAARTFLESLRPQDSASVVAFNDKVREVVAATNDRALLQAGIDGLQADGNTAIYDALYSSAQTINAMNANKRRVIILLTDGEDTSSKYEPAVATDVAKQTGSFVYTIGLGPDARDNVLKKLAEPSGGKYYKAPSAADLKAIYAAIAVDLNSQLFLTYRSVTHTERSYQVVNVEVKYTAPDGQVLAQTISYRPPVEAVVAPTRAPYVATPFAGPLAVALPPGLRNGGQQSRAATAPLRPTFPVTAISIGAVVLACVAAIMAVMGFAVMITPSSTSNRIERYILRTNADLVDQERGPGLVARRLIPLVEAAGKGVARLSPKNYTDLIANMIVLLGPPYRLTVGAFLGIQLVLSAISVAIVSFIIARSDSPVPAQWAMGAFVAFGMGAYLPYVWLKRQVMKRQKAVLRALPGALDFLAINVEAGLGFDAALGQVVKRWQNTLTDEFAMLLIDFRIGKARKDAWRDLLRRTQVPELTSFVTAMLQNEQVGISIGTLLRTQADQMRVRRRQAAEEAARTAPVKMLLPMVFFIFPGVFVIILGPAIPQFLAVFGGFGK